MQKVRHDYRMVLSRKIRNNTGGQLYACSIPRKLNFHMLVPHFIRNLKYAFVGIQHHKLHNNKGVFKWKNLIFLFAKNPA